MEYLYRIEDGDTRPCDCCQWEAPLGLFRGGYGIGPDKWLCEVCSSTTISRMVRDGSSSPEDYQAQQTYRIMAEVANLLLDKLTGRKAATPPHKDQ